MKRERERWEKGQAFKEVEKGRAETRGRGKGVGGGEGDERGCFVSADRGWRCCVVFELRLPPLLVDGPNQYS